MCLAYVLCHQHQQEPFDSTYATSHWGDVAVNCGGGAQKVQSTNVADAAIRLWWY